MKNKLRILIKQKSFEVDMSFKKVWTCNVNEVVFAMFNQSMRKDNQLFINLWLIFS